MPPKVEQKSKAAKLLAAQSSSRSKQKKKKWSKGKQKEKKDNAVVFDAALHEKFMKEVPKMKTITVASVSERLHVNGSLCRRALAVLEKEGHIIPVVKHSSQVIYTRA